MAFALGDRVRISGGFSWAQGATGTIALPPSFAETLVEDSAPWDGWHRIVEGFNGPVEFYWVKFDELHRDADGDGPYGEAEISAKVLEHIS